MRVTITEYKSLAVDANGHIMPLGKLRLAVQSQTAFGAFAALNADTRFIRIATDTAVTLDIDASATDELYMPGVEFMPTHGGEVLTTAAA